MIVSIWNARRGKLVIGKQVYVNRLAPKIVIVLKMNSVLRSLSFVRRSFVVKLIPIARRDLVWAVFVLAVRMIPIAKQVLLVLLVHVYQTLLGLTRVRLPIAMKLPRPVTHWMAVVIRPTAHAHLMMNAGKYTIAVSLEFARGVKLTVIVDLTSAVFSLLVCCFNENEALSYVQYL